MTKYTDPKPIAELISTFAQAGTVVWIGLRPASRQTIVSATETYARVGTGLDGDRYKGTSDSKRQVTLIQAEHLEAVASYLGKESIDPALTRRNILVKGINLLALKDHQFQIGEAILEVTDLCHPCSRMEENLGTGGYNAMRGHGGITTRVIKEGKISVGDSVRVLPKI
jgi:MOSC domain-containing protein YiiM